MVVFLVRHGASSADENIWQTPDSPLSDEGRKQARALYERPRFRNVDVVFSSKWPRAAETAKIVADMLNKPLKLFEGIHEREQHPKIYGSKRSSKIGRRYYKETIENYMDLDWKFEGIEESYRDVIKRAIKFKKHLIKNRPEQNLLVVSHDVFIRCFITVCILGEDYKDDAFGRVFRSLRLATASISLLEYDEKRNIWKLWYLNDFSHLIGFGEKRASRN